MKHTPGPWEVGEEEDDSQWVFIWTDSQTKLIGSASNEDVSTEERLANANLIAAAPCLLDALTRLTDDIENSHKHAACIDMGTLIRNARAAIAKATGVTP